MPRRLHDFETSRYQGSAEITGFRDSSGRWNHLSAGGRWYTGQPSEAGSGHRHRGLSPSNEDLSRGREFSVHIRYRNRDYFYTYHTPRGISGQGIEADFRARLKAGYFRRYGARRV